MDPAGQRPTELAPSARRRHRLPTGAWADRLWLLERPWNIAGIFVVGVVVRLLLVPHFGFYGDLRYFRLWAGRLEELGLGNFYAPDYFADYPSGFLYVLAVLGKFSSAPNYWLLKTPIIIGDLALAWFSALLAHRLAPVSLRERLPVRALTLIIVLFNPAVLGVGALWGQVDSVPSSLVVACLVLVLTGRRSVQRDFGGLVLLGIAISMKPQSAFLVPVLTYFLIRRYVVDAPAALRLRGTAYLLGISVVSASVWLFSGVPFGLSPTGLIRFLRNSANTYPVTSANAFNFWGLFGFFQRDSDLYWDGQTDVVTVLGMKAQTFGNLLVLIGIFVVLWLTHRAIARGVDRARAVVAGAVAMNLIAYTLLTRMHERYMFPVLACLAPLALWKGFRSAYWTLSALFVINLWYPFALFNGQWNDIGQVGRVYGLQWQPVFRWFFGDINAADTDQKKFWSLLVVIVTFLVVGLFTTWLMRTMGTATPTGTPSPRAPTAGARTGWPATDDPSPTGPTSTTSAESAASAPTMDPRLALARSWLRRARNVVPLPGGEHPHPPGWATRLPPFIVGIVCMFCLLALQGETRSARTLNDTTFHLQMIRWARRQLESGRLPLDGWFPDLTLGSSFFHHYQSLPYTVTAIIGRTLHMSTSSIYLWLVYLLVSLWPISVYLSGRLLGFGRWGAAAAAVVSPLIMSVPGYGYEHSSYTFQGWGVYTQLWGMWLLPLAWGIAARAIRRGRGYPLAALALAMTIATHLMTGYLAVITIGVLGLLGARGALARIGRAAIVLVGGLLTAAWVLVPLLADQDVSAQSVFYQGTLYNDSYGAKQILAWLFQGDIYDGNRFPIITLLAGVGFIVCILHLHTERARVLVSLWTVSLVLYFGRVTWKSALKILPGSDDLQMHRFIIGVQLAGILMAGIGIVVLCVQLTRGLTWLWRRLAEATGPDRAAWWSRRNLTITSAAVVVLATVGGLTPAWRKVWDYDRGGEAYIAQQRLYDATDGRDIDRLIQIANERGDGRIYAGTRANWGPSFKVGFVPVLHMASHNDADSIGFTFRTVQSLTTDIEASFDENNLAQYEMLNVKYYLAPSDRVPSVPHEVLATAGRSTLYLIPTSGYFQVVDRIGSVSANRKDINEATSTFRNSNSALLGIYPGVAFNGGAAPRDTIATSPGTPAGAVITQSHQRDNGKFSAQVRADRPAVVVLKATYDPRWEVRVNGKRARLVMMAPSIVGVDVPAGTHSVEFTYRSYPHYPWLFLLGVFALLVLGAVPHRARVLASLRYIRQRINTRMNTQGAPRLRR